MYVVFNMGIIYYGVLQFKLRYVIQEIYLFLLHTFHVRIPSTAREQLLVFHRAPPLVADGERSPDMVGTGEIKYRGQTKTSTAALQFDIGLSRARGRKP